MLSSSVSTPSLYRLKRLCSLYSSNTFRSAASISTATTSSSSASTSSSSAPPSFIITSPSSSTTTTTSHQDDLNRPEYITNPLKSSLNISNVVSVRPTSSLVFPILFKQLSPQLERVGSPYKTLNLTAEEIYYFNLFRDVLKYFRREDVQLRVAGGWVRNKLLGIEGGCDIDIAVDNITGREFVNMIQQYFQILSNNNSPFLKNYIVKCNPEKSKHLETASLVVQGGLTFDFAGLRSEEYDEFSRIPIVVKGTLISDSHRRDITINSLYYNLMTMRVEDYTLMGLPDLEKKIVRTPLSPIITLCEDPLRALRVLRFSNRFSFTIESELYESLCSNRVRDLLGLKVSRERIHTEFSSMMSSYRYAIPYFQTLIDTGLIHSIFPTNGLLTIQDWHTSLTYLEKSTLIAREMAIPAESIQEFILSSIFLPLKLKYGDQLDVYQILLDFKYSKRICLNVSNTLSSYHALEVPVRVITSSSGTFDHLMNDSHAFEQVLVPLLKWLRHNQLWKAKLWTARLYFEMNHHPQLTQNGQLWKDAQTIIEKDYVSLSNIKFCLEVKQLMDALGIAHACDVKPCVDQIMAYQWKHQSNKFSLDHIVNFLKSSSPSSQPSSSHS